jgi:hypothetical protein
MKHVSELEFGPRHSGPRNYTLNHYPTPCRFGKEEDAVYSGTKEKLGYMFLEVILGKEYDWQLVS